MHRIVPLLAFLLLMSVAAAPSARACGFTEAPVDCGDNAENQARYMLNRVVTAVNQDKAKALAAFTRGAEGFRSVDSYVFCIGPTGIMTAHPSPMLQGQDVKDLHDNTGNYFIATMMKTAEPGQVKQIRYLFPRPGATTATQKTTFYTRAGDQVCAVGVYDTDDVSTAPMTVEARLRMLRERLTAAMPANLGADWAAYQQALDEQTAAQTAAVAKARDQLHAVDTVLASSAGGPASR